MSQQDEIAQLRALIAQLTERVYALEQAVRAQGVAMRRGEPQHAAPPIQRASKVTEREQPPHSDRGIPPQPDVARVGQQGPSAPQHVTPVPQPRTPVFSSSVGPQQVTRPPEGDLESRIGSQWLNRIGIIATLVGISYFLKYAFENNWIGPAGRVSIGLLAGIAIVWWSEVFRRKGHLVFSWSLKAIGIGAMYLSLWAAFQIYHLIPDAAAFVAMVLVTAFTAVLSLRQDAEVLAALALVGGFVTPILLSTNQNREVQLFSYVAVLDVATLALLSLKPWRRLLAFAYAGTQVLFWAWYFSFYRAEFLGITVAFASAFFVIFLIAPLTAHLPDDVSATSRTLVFIPLINAAVFFLTLYGLLEDKHHELLAWIAVALAAIYLLLARQIERRGIRDSSSARLLDFIYIALAVGFLTTAIPLKLSAQWITFGWLVESAVLLYVGYHLCSGFLKVLALVSLILGLVRLVAWDSGQVSTLLFNTRFALYLVAIAAVTWALYLGRDEDSDEIRNLRAIGVVAINALALLALSLEVHDYFQQQIDAAYRGLRAGQGRVYWQEFSHLNKLRGFAYSAVWMAYGAVLMWIGFAKRTAFLRWQALVLLAVTIVKVFVYDTSQLETPYRVLSFIALGVILLAVSFAYQKDWLKLNVHRDAGSEQA
jgi:uncharacterized membrane protein